MANKPIKSKIKPRVSTPASLTRKTMWSQLDYPNLIAGVVIGVVTSSVFYLMGVAGAATQQKVDAKNMQLILRAIEQSGGEVRYVRDDSGAIVNVSVELQAVGRAESSATAELSVKPQGQ